MKKIETVKEFDGWLSRYSHWSSSCDCEMTFSLFLPAQTNHETFPSLYWLSGLTCTDDNFRVKAGAQRYAAEYGVALIIPDTSPRGDTVADEPDRYDLGKGAGFYINATQAPWKKNYQMYRYITEELPMLIKEHFPVNDKQSIFGHSMGGHGALIAAIKNPNIYSSVSAFAPICHPTKCPWGETIFQQYLGDDKKTWQQYDACCLIQSTSKPIPILIDQGSDDEFLQEQLHPQDLKTVCEEHNYPLNLRIQPGYDHSYHFIATFIGEHIEYHASALRK